MEIPSELQGHVVVPLGDGNVETIGGSRDQGLQGREVRKLAPFPLEVAISQIRANARLQVGQQEGRDVLRLFILEHQGGHSSRGANFVRVFEERGKAWN